jgi:hypothetical protein
MLGVEPHNEEFMKLIRLGGIAIFLASAFSADVMAAGNDYLCTIEKLSLAGGDSGVVYEFYKKNYIGKQFTVERASGLMAGALKNSYLTKPQVIDWGSKENSYKVITTMRREQGVGAGSNIYALTIVEYEQGPKKPFIFLENDKVYFGHCEHF